MPIQITIRDKSPGPPNRASNDLPVWRNRSIDFHCIELKVTKQVFWLREVVIVSVVVKSAATSITDLRSNKR